jgi:hypothetical protein
LIVVVEPFTIRSLTVSVENPVSVEFLSSKLPLLFLNIGNQLQDFLKEYSEV